MNKSILIFTLILFSGSTLKGQMNTDSVLNLYFKDKPHVISNKEIIKKISISDTIVNSPIKTNSRQAFFYKLCHPFIIHLSYSVIDTCVSIDSVYYISGNQYGFVRNYFVLCYSNDGTFKGIYYFSPWSQMNIYRKICEILLKPEKNDFYD